ncbi:unnamed protein product [Discosporangium mesarthrocarpum]
MPYKGCVDKEQLAKDEELAREAARYLWDVAIPAINMDMKRGSLCPNDCSSLAASLHNMGVNIRYLGRLAQLAVEEEREDVT